MRRMVLAALIPVVFFVSMVGLVSATPSAQQGEKIGFQSGIDASVNRWIAKDPAGQAAYEKLRRTLKLLAADYDGRQVSSTPPPPPPPPPPPGAGGLTGGGG
jgi:ferric-dicitrate binding protein FerR (iron transport regulator)